MRKHFVTFLSPGTFVSESMTQEIASWDTDQAMTMARSIKERYGATPYGFYFTTRERGPADFDSKEVERSPGNYYLGGKIEALEEIEARGDPNDSILISNLKSGHYSHAITNTNSWKFTSFFRPDKDVLLDYKTEAA